MIGIGTYIILGMLVLLALFVSRALFNWRKRDSEEERTKRLSDWLAFRLERWKRWTRGGK